MATKMKRLFSILLSLALVTGLVPGMSVTAYAAEHTHDGVTFEPWDDDDWLPFYSGNYYLTKDVTLSGTWLVKENISLCLNGHTIQGNGNFNVISIDGALLSLYDCSPDAAGTITKGIYGVHIDGNRTFNMYGGTISGNTESGVYINQGSFTMNGGTIKENGSSTVSNGGGVYINQGSFTMNGGTIKENGSSTVSNGGGVYINSGSFTMNGGTIKENGSSTVSNGGGVYIGENNGSGNNTFIMNNGTISNNTATNGGGVYVSSYFAMNNSSTISGNTATNGGGVYNNGKFFLTGGSIKDNEAFAGGGIFNLDDLTIYNVTINNNTASDKGGGVYNEKDFYLEEKPTITGNTVNGQANNAYLANGGLINISYPLYSAASVGVTKDNGGTFTSDYKKYNPGTDPSEFFESDMDEYYVTFDANKEAQLAKKPKVTFDANGHGTAPASQYVVPDGKATKPEDPTAEGYTFGGWYKEAACENAWNFDSDTVTADTTIYAKWIKKAVVTKAPTANTLTYNGSAQELFTAGTASGGTMYYAFGADATTAPTTGWDTAVLKKTEPGTWYVWYKAVGDGTHSDSDAVPLTVTIAQASIADADVTLDSTSLVYTGTEQKVTVTGVKLGETTLTAGQDYEVTGGTTGTNKGTYTVTVTGKGNYKDTASAQWSIGLATPVISTAPTASAITYGQTLKDSTLSGGKATLGETEVAGSFAWKNAAVAPAVSNSETTEYDVVFTPADTENYGVAECKVKLTVNRASAVAATVTANNRTCDGTEKPLVTVDTATLSGGEMRYALGTDATTVPAESAFTAAIPAKAEAGTWYIWYKVVGDENHLDTKPEVIQVTIAPMAITYAFTEGDGAEWTKGSESGPSFTVKGSPEDGETFSRFTGLLTDNGTVAAENYTAAAGSVKLTLKPAYLETLAEGKHTLTAVFTDGKAEASFTVNAAAPATATATATATPTPAPTPTATATATATATPIATATATATAAPTATPTLTPAPTATAGPTKQPTPTATPKPAPKTGDSADCILWLGLVLLGLTGGGICLRSYRTKRNSGKKR